LINEEPPISFSMGGIIGQSPTVSNAATPSFPGQSPGLVAQSSSSVTSPASYQDQQGHIVGPAHHHHPPFVVQPSISSTTGSLGAEPKSALKQRLGRSLDMSEPLSHVSSSSRSDSVSSGSDAKRLSFLVAKEQGHSVSGDGLPWDETQQAGGGPGGAPGGGPSDSKNKFTLGAVGSIKRGGETSQGFFGRKVENIQGWWSDMSVRDEDVSLDD
jgi:hypothetical protein